MKILHTADWHLGKIFYSKKERQEEHTKFLDWLLNIIKENSIELVIIAGDIFDTTSPSSSSQKMYYTFLAKLKKVGCKNVIVVGGNHDSPSLLNAPKDILAAMDVSVIGNATENIADELIVVKDDKDCPLLIVCAVPFLRERDISRFVEGENYADKAKRVNGNIQKHYEEIAQLAENKRKELGKNIPIIATGHLSVVGGKRSQDDGVRETIGNIEAISSDIFPKIFDYVALGHYHIPSTIKDNIRYCGSPIPMGFGEVGQKKIVYVIDFTNGKKIEKIEIPIFQKLESIVGDKNFIENRLRELKKLSESVWVEVIYNGNEIFPDLVAFVNEQIAHSKIEVLKIPPLQYLNEGLTINDVAVSLDEINEYDVFDKLLEKESISDEQKEELKESYKEIVVDINMENNAL